MSSLLRDWPTASLHRQAVVYGNLLTLWVFWLKEKNKHPFIMYMYDRRATRFEIYYLIIHMTQALVFL